MCKLETWVENLPSARESIGVSSLLLRREQGFVKRYGRADEEGAREQQSTCEPLVR